MFADLALTLAMMYYIINIIWQNVIEHQASENSRYHWDSRKFRIYFIDFSQLTFLLKCDLQDYNNYVSDWFTIYILL